MCQPLLWHKGVMGMGETVSSCFLALLVGVWVGEEGYSHIRFETEMSPAIQ